MAIQKMVPAGCCRIYLFVYFLVSLQEVTGEDDSDLYLEERETELKKIQEEKRRMMMAVPGMLNPHEMPEDMQDE